MSYHLAPLARRAFAACVGAALVVSAGTALGQAKGGAKPLQGQVVKLAWIDPLSGLMASGRQQPAQQLEVRDREVQSRSTRPA